MDLLTETINLLKASEQSIQQIADGAGVSQRWIRYVMAGDVDPTFGKLKTLHEYLLAQNTPDAA